MSWKLLGHCDTLRSNIPGCLMHLLLSLLILREYVAIFNQFCCFRPFRRCKTWYQITLQRASPWNRLCGRDRMSKFSFTPISGKIFDFAKKRISKENISLLSFIIKQKEVFFQDTFLRISSARCIIDVEHEGRRIIHFMWKRVLKVTCTKCLSPLNTPPPPPSQRPKHLTNNAKASVRKYGILV